MKKIAIIGGGASGLTAAIVAAEGGLDVLVFEHNDRVGKKILASGNGRCNISNTNIHVYDYFGESPSFVTDALKQFDFKAFERFFFKMGLLLDIKDDGRVYPYSNEAKAVTTTLQNYALSLGVKIITHSHVEYICKNETHFNLHVKESNSSHDNNFDAVLIATGSEAAPQLGANGSGYALAQQFDHSIIPTYPSLVQLHLDSPYHAKMSGVKQHAHVTLYINGKKEDDVTGDILFTKYGISGFAILDLSQKASLALMHYSAVSIGIDLFHSMNRQQLSATISSICNHLCEYSILEIITTLVPSKMAPLLLKNASIDAQTRAKSLNSKQIKQLVNTLKNWRFNVTQTHGFTHAEVSGGGVCTSEINPKSMESLKVSDLYFAGEVLDVVGRRGGYNLHFAFASGILAAKSIVKNLIK